MGYFPPGQGENNVKLIEVSGLRHVQSAISTQTGYLHHYFSKQKKQYRTLISKEECI